MPFTAQAAPGATSAKLEKLPRPKFSLEMTESEWKFKEQSWKAYIGQTPNLAEETKVQQLQAACEESLLRRVHDSGGLTQFITEVALLARIKTLAVKMTHQTMHIQNLHKMKQDPEEGIRAFASRLVGTAALCDLTVTCSGEGCDVKTSFQDFLVLHAILRGMFDEEIRTRVLSRHQNNELKTLPELIDYIDAEEVSTKSFQMINDPANSVHNNAFSSFSQSGYFSIFQLLQFNRVSQRQSARGTVLVIIPVQGAEQAADPDLRHGSGYLRD